MELLVFFFEHGEDFSLELASEELPADRNQLFLLQRSPRSGLRCPAALGLGEAASGQQRGQEAWGDLQLHSSPSCPLCLFSLSLFARPGVCANAACARRAAGASCPSAARVGFPPARSLEEVSPPSQAL